MNIAYLISAHTDAPQLKRLIEALQSDAEFFIHIDKKSDIAPFIRLLQGSHIHFIPDRVDVVWGTMVEVQYQMNLIRAAVTFPSRHFDHICFLSGLDYPLVSADRITQWLQARAGQEHLWAYCMDNPQLSPFQRENYTVARPWCRWRKMAIALRMAGKALGRRKKLHFTVGDRQWKLYKGGAWWCISQELAAHILQQYDSQPAVRRYFSDSFGPAETLIPTIAMNHLQWRTRCRLYEGAYPGLPALSPLHFIDYDPVIKVLDLTDYERLMQSGKLFCRKVVSGRSDQLVEMIRKANVTLPM